MNNLNLFKQSWRFLAARTLFYRPQYINFSEYFRQKDIQDLWAYNDRKIINKKYRGLVDMWKRPLQRKRLRQARIRQIKAKLPQPQPQDEKLVVHNPAIGIRTPQSDAIFAIIKIDGRQFKVTNDCMILLDTKQEHDINLKLTFDEVLLVGTDTYTAIGRPVVKNAKVEGVIESVSRSDKILVFKKKRRKQYKKSFGSKVPLTSCRITGIVHNLTQDILSKAMPLQ